MTGFYANHNSQHLNYRKPFGALEEGTEVTITIDTQVCEEVFIEIVHFGGFCERIAMEPSKKTELHREDKNKIISYSTKILLQDAGIVNYYFILNNKGKTYYYGNNKEKFGGEGLLSGESPNPYQITVYKPFKVPAWYKEGIIYQIFVDRFANGNEDGHIDNPKKNSFLYGSWEDEPMYIKNSQGEIERWDFYGGNLKGIIEKLNYIKSLGVTCIYLNPIFEAASNHKYDAADYKNIDPMFGDDETFKELCSKAEELNMKVVLDGVFSHTGADSIYFNKYGNYPSLGAYQSMDSPYYSWYQFRNYPEEYKCWWGFKNHPDVNELNKDYMNFIINDEDSVSSKWMSLGAAGWRLDVADELPDEFIKVLKKKMKKLREDSVLIGEVWEDASNKISYDVKREYFLGEELDSVTNYPFKDAILGFLRGEHKAEDIKKRLMSLYENYPKEAFYSSMNVLGTHDTERMYTALSSRGEMEGKELLKLAVAFQMTFPGVPLIYYGDEAGLKGGKDPKNRAPYPWGREDHQILDLYKKLTAIRAKEDVFKKGDLNFYSLDDDILAYERKYAQDTAFILLNRSTQEKKVVLEDRYIKGKELITGKEIIASKEITLMPLEVKIIAQLNKQHK